MFILILENSSSSLMDKTVKEKTNSSLNRSLSIPLSGSLSSTLDSSYETIP